MQTSYANGPHEEVQPDACTTAVENGFPILPELCLNVGENLANFFFMILPGHGKLTVFRMLHLFLSGANPIWNIEQDGASDNPGKL